MVNSYYKLLIKYKSLPEIERSTSIFHVSGYPHYERVCSNVLAFYLNPQREHGLGDLVLSSLLDIAGYEIGTNLSTVKIDREYYTLNGGFLDLLIVSDAFVIGIENKIYHYLNNDLADYKKTIDQKANLPQKIPIRIVLSLKSVQIPQEVGFINITYRQLWDKVKSNLGFSTSSATHKWIKWVIYLYDFMDSTALLGGDNMGFADNDQFFIENDDVIKKLIGDREAFIGRLNTRVIEIKEMIESSDAAPKNFENRWVYNSKCLVHDYILSGHEITFDLSIEPKGWTLQLFERHRPLNNYVTQLVSARRDKLIIENGRFVIATWPLSSSLEEIKEVLFDWMAWIIQEDAKNIA